ncbi:MAG: oligosaccharide flippase family protein [Phaeodactylibacter sp.]|nr:oligosaccharide flippase family protein [Phaeodactylibacter sp.]
MKREFLINIIFLLAVNLLIKPFYLFGIDRTVQNTVPVGDYGIYFALFNFTFLFQIVNDFGIQNFNNRNIAQYNHLLGKYFPNILILKSLLGTLYLLLVFLAAWFAGYGLDVLPLLAIIAVNQVLNSLVLFLRSNVSGLGRYRLDSLLSVTDRLLLILVCGVLLWAPPFRGAFRIEWFAWAHTFALSATALLAFGVIRGRLPTLRFRFRWPFLLLLLRRSAPYALAVFLTSIYNRIDGVMVERLLPDGQVEADIYASAFRLFEASNMIGFLFAGLLLPIFSGMIRRGEAVGSLAQLSFRLVGAGALVLFCGIFFYRTEIMIALYDSGSVYSGRVLAYLMGGFFAVCGTYIFGTLLVANDSLRQLNYVFAASLLFNVVLNFLLIPRYKAEGAAIATCITQFGVLACELLLAHRLLQPGNTGGAIFRFSALLALALAAGLLIQSCPGPGWLWRFLATLAAGGVFALMLGLVDVRGLAQWRR